ncbi:type VII secretion integral membrane protein EccD [Demequina globuliformis]|uniref:type VII secretion integral membrane protein EccD n=1 Tax=Demequina globuliformis TaxID=676202 RepID=UPI0007804F0D|nr:type VII secretion integral membrane protein EccD [Demequina globuliformis]
MSTPATSTSTVVRVSVLSDDRRLDIAIPGAVPLVEVIPGFARNLGSLDPTLVHGGYALRRADGSPLDSSLSATAQSIHDGDVLTLVRGELLVEPKVYDDITEAVLDATSDHHHTWTGTDSARTALAVALSFLALCAVVLLSMGRPSAVGALIAAGGAAVLIAAAAVLDRMDQPESGRGLALAAALYAALAGFLIGPEGSVWGWPLAFAGAGAAAAGGLALVLTRRHHFVPLAAVTAGVVAGVPALISGLEPAWQTAAWVVVMAVGGALGNLLPWLAFSSARIPALSFANEQDIFADPAPIEADAVKARARAGGQVLQALRLGLGVVLLLATPLVASASTFGAVLAALVFVGMMFQSRQAYARSAVMVIMAMGTVGLAVTGLTVAVAQPDLRAIMLPVVLTVTGVLVAVALLNPRARMRLARVADTVEVLILASLLPLGVLAAGWI